MVVAFCDLNSGEFELAARYLADAVGFYAGLTDAAERTHLPLAYAGLGVLHALRGHRAQAFDAFQKGIREAEANADGILRAAVLAAMAEFTAEFDCEGAAAAAQEALDFLKAAGERWWITWAQRALGLAFLYRGDPDMASLRLQPLTELDLSPLEMARTHLYLGEAAIVASDVRRARTALGEAVALLRNIGSKLLLARALLALASLDVSPVTSPRAAAVEVIRAQTDVAYGRLLPPLEICLLGTAQVSVDHKVRRFRTTRAKELVFYLLLASRNQLDREPLGLKWWRGSPSAKRSQNVADTISLARTGLGSEGWRLTTPEHGIVALDRRWIAVDYFDASAATDTLSRMSEPIGLETRLQAEQLLALLRNPLLPAWADEDWVQKEDAIRQRKVRDLEAFLKRQCR